MSVIEWLVVMGSMVWMRDLRTHTSACRVPPTCKRIGGGTQAHQMGQAGQSALGMLVDGLDVVDLHRVMRACTCAVALVCMCVCVC